METTPLWAPATGPISGVELLRAAWRRRWLIAMLTMGLTALTLAVAMRLPKAYRAEVLLQTDLRAGRAVDGDVTALSPELDGGGLSGQRDIIFSPGIAQKVIASERLLDEPEYHRTLDPYGAAPHDAILRSVLEWLHALAGSILPEDFAVRPPIDAAAEARMEEYRRTEDAIRFFQKHLQVDYDLRGSSLRIRYVSEDPNLAAQVANAVARAYVDQQTERKLELLRGASQWLSERLESLRSKAVEAESRLAEFRQEHNLGTNEAPVFTQQQLADLHGQLIAAVGAQTEAEARVRRAEEAAREHRLGGIPEAINSPTVRVLREQEAILSRRIAELNSGGNIRTANDVRAELGQVNRRIQEELERIHNSLRSEAEVARARRVSLEATIARLTAQAAERERYSVRAAVLEREAAANRAVFDAAIRRVEETRTLDGLQRPDVSIVSEASVPGRPYKPSLRLLGGMGLVTSFVVGLGVATLVEFRRRTLRSLAQGEAALGIHGMGWTPALRISRGKSVDDIVVTEPDHLLSECLRSIAVAMRTSGGRGTRVILVTSAVRGEGKTTFALSYARTIAASGQSCLLIEADFRRPTIRTRLRAEVRHDSSDVAGGQHARLQDVVQTDVASGLDFVAAGSVGSDPLRALDGASFGMFLEEAREWYDTIVIDAPPILAVADGAMVAQHADVVLLIVAWARTPVRLAARALVRMQRAGAQKIAFVLSLVDPGRLPRDQDERLAMEYAYSKAPPQRRPRLRLVGGGQAVTREHGK